MKDAYLSIRLSLLSLALASVCSLFVFVPIASAQGSRALRLVITVTSSERNEPVEGASVNVKWKFDTAMEPLRLESQDTDQSGRVWVIPATFGGLMKIEPKLGQNFEIKITHTDYEDAFVSVPVRKTSGDIPVSVSLKKKAGRKLVAVQVNSAGDRAPVYDATVKLRGTKSPTAFSGATDSGGQALISVTESDDYEVEVTRTGFESVRSTVSVKIHEDQTNYDLRLVMRRLNEPERTLRVFVRGKDKDGKLGSVRYAQVTLPDGQMKTTDYEGAVEFKHKLPPGEDARIEVEATYFKPGSAGVTIGARGLAGDSVTVQLEREGPRDVAGSWSFVCCNAKYKGTMTLTQNGATIGGYFGDTSNGTTGEIDGKIEGSTLTFKRTITADKVQNYTLTLSADGKTLTGDFEGYKDPAVGTDFSANRK